MQKVMVIGYLGNDPDFRIAQSNTAIATFSVATTERWKDNSGQPKEHTEWFHVKVFGNRAETVNQYLHKGSRVYLEGRKRTESWEDKQSGEKKYRDFVYADRVEFLDSKGNGNGSGRGAAQHENGSAPIGEGNEYGPDPGTQFDPDVPF